MFDKPKDLPFSIRSHKFDIDGWQFVVLGCYYGDTWSFRWTELLHMTCKKPISFKYHRHEVRGYCKACDVRMPYHTWEIIKSQVSTLRYGDKLA